MSIGAFILTATSHSGQVGTGGLGVGKVVNEQVSVLLEISQMSEQIIVRHIPDPMCCMSSIVSP